jgi:hypothetical protein
MPLDVIKVRLQMPGSDGKPLYKVAGLPSVPCTRQLLG